MNTTDHAAMTDRELDRAIAEHVFGRDPMDARVGLHPADGDVEYHWGYPVGHDIAPHYSTDPAAMMQVVEAMKAKGFWCRIQSPFTPTGEWHVGFTPHGTTGWNGRPDFDAHADTPMRAAALSALAAVAAQPEAT